MYSLKNRILWFFAAIFRERRIVFSSSKGTRTVRIKSYYQIIFAILIMALLIFIADETFSFYAKKSKLKQVFNERSNLLTINSQLNSHVLGLNEEIKEINKYLESIGNKPISKLRKNINNKISYNDNNLDAYKQSLAQTDESMEESAALMEEAIDYLNIRSNNIVSIIRNLKIPVNLIKDSLKNPFYSNITEINNIYSDLKSSPGYNLEDMLKIYKKNFSPYYDNFSQKISDMIDAEYIVAYLPVHSPLGSYRITSNYGIRIDPITHHISRHEGIDLKGELKASVYATGNGVVRFAGWAGGYGYMVDIDHGNNIITRYGHMDRINVVKGQHVTPNSILGEQGSTGKSTGLHVHYEVRHKNHSINPYQFIVALRN